MVVLDVVLTVFKMPPRGWEYDHPTDVRLKHHAPVHIFGWQTHTYVYKLDISTRVASMLEPTPPPALL